MLKFSKIKTGAITFYSMLAILLTPTASAESLSNIKEKMSETVSFFMTVSPDSKTLSSSNPVQIGSQQFAFKELNSRLHEGRTLIIKTIIVDNLSLPAPDQDAYSVIAFARCDIDNLSIAGFGNSAISTYGLQSNTVYFNPGLVVSMPDSNDSLCVSSYIQSNEEARVFIHGVLL